ncbi:uncharacterized protein LOC121995330 [Zingiber officinale]|uniref:uncharacterized protein LOC121995330 n=1 Tax=Zingiber officinale TaxID=94328 RepID=UPI001C4D5077|nr:uncharacterized protein LOC121995330 [Zingiber officinale]
MVSPKYVIDPKKGGEKAGDRTDPFRWMIDGFSTIANRGAETYSSGTFTACGFTWELLLESVSEEDGEKYVGLYLSHDNAASKNSVIKAIYKLFIYDQLHAEHIQKEGEDYFHSKSHDGFCCKVALNKFNNSKSGLLVNDCCIFGAEVLEAFACKLDKEGISVYNWRISLYPNLHTYEDSLAFFLEMDNAASLSSKTSVYVDFSLCLLDQHNAKNLKFTAKHLFSTKSDSWGWHKFLSWNDVKDPLRGFLLNDTCIIEASIVILGVDTIA